MKSIMLSICGLLACAAGAFPLNPSFTPEAVAAYKAKADAGDAEAQYLYSSALANGRGVAEDKPQAFAYAKKAVDQGYERVLNLVGLGYEEGWGIESNATKAAECYSRFVSWAAKAAENGDANAQRNLGWCYANGNGVETNQVEAVKWYRKAAEQGDAMAQCSLGWCYKNGEGVETNKTKAVKWLRRAAEQDLALAQRILGIFYAMGEGVKKDMAEAVKWFRKAAEQGDADAQAVLGRCYTIGEGVKKDMTEAVKWCRKSAEQDDAWAQCLLGACFAKGAGVAKDMTEAVKWFRKAAEQGNTKAQLNLGWCYAEGEGVEKDAVISGQWYLKAAKGNSFLAALMSKQDCVFVSTFVFLFVIHVCVLIVATYLPCTIVRVLQSERSLVKRLFADLESVICSLSAVIYLFAYLLLIKDSDIALWEFIVVDFPPLSVGSYILLVCGFFSAYYGIRTFVERRRLRRLPTRPHVTFAQYVKACVVDKICAIGVVGLWFAFVLALLGYLVLSGVYVLGTIALMIYTWPTRKKYDKLVNGETKE